MPKRRSDELAAIDEVMPLVDQYNELEHAQRLIFLDMVDPLPEEAAPTEKPTKVAAKRKIERCEVCNYTRRALQHVNPQHTDYHEFVKTEKASKKSSTSKSATKSERASGMAAQLKERRQEQREVVTTKDDNYDGGQDQCSDCGMAADMPIHSPEGGYITYHPFRSTAPPAPVASPANGKGTNGTANSETEKADVGNVHHVASGD